MCTNCWHFFIKQCLDIKKSDAPRLLCGDAEDFLPVCDIATFVPNMTLNWQLTIFTSLQAFQHSYSLMLPSCFPSLSFVLFRNIIQMRKWSDWQQYETGTRFDDWVYFKIQILFSHTFGHKTPCLFRTSSFVWFLAFSDAVRFHLGINGTQMVWWRYVSGLEQNDVTVIKLSCCNEVRR